MTPHPDDADAWTVPLTTGAVIDAYGSQVQQVVKTLGAMGTTVDPARVRIEQWADTVTGPILDVGSGTGRWSGHLASLGHEIEGLEPVAPLVDIARTAYPAVPFRLGSIADLTGSTDRWAGILAWFALIHLGPDELAEALATLRAVLDDSGSLLLSFFSGARLEQFDHPITTAYRWPPEDMWQALDTAGFAVMALHSDPGTSHAQVIARVVPSARTRIPIAGVSL